MKSKVIHALPSYVQGGGRERLVSVVMPTRNRAGLTVNAAMSVLKQSYRPVELVIVDDGSTDGSDKRVEEWIRSVQPCDVQIKMLRQDQKGAPAARNLGAASCEGEFIQFMDSDDLMHPDKLLNQVCALVQNPDCDFCFCNYAKLSTDEMLPQTATLQTRDYDLRTAMFLRNVPGTVWCCLYRRRVVALNGPWNESLKKWQDLDYTARMYCAMTLRAIYLPEVLYYFRTHEGARIRDLYTSAAGVEYALQALRSIRDTLDANKSWDEHLAKQIAQFYVGVAVQAMRHGPRNKVDEALDHACKLCVPVSFRRNLNRLYVMHSILGAPLTAALFPMQARLSKLLHFVLGRAAPVDNIFENATSRLR